MRPPSSLRKPHVSDTTPNRAFLRGFSATQFPDFGLCRRSRILVAGFGALSPHLKIPFPAVGLEREVRPRFAPGIRDRGRALQLFRIESERLKLPAPFGRRIAEPLDADAAGLHAQPVATKVSPPRCITAGRPRCADEVELGERQDPVPVERRLRRSRSRPAS